MRDRAILMLALLLVPSLVLAASVQQPADYFLIRGSAVIKSVNPNNIRIVVHSFGLAGNDPSGTVDHIFNFWSRTAVPYVDFATELAGIEYTGEQLTVLAADRERQFVFDVTSEQPLDRDRGEDPGRGLRRITPAGFDGQVFHGYGLNHQMGAAVNAHKMLLGPAHPLQDCPECWEDSFIDSASGGGGTTCNAGGPGSTSCSYTSGPNSCSVGCGGGYYACCNASNNCRCVPNGQ
jgi:hypothetical protein